ncbi:hypothetical protein J2S28_003211 [Rhizobium sp. SLBN-94]|nr:hypothetical protein [Rhizobium sp. SLBN-94]
MKTSRFSEPQILAILRQTEGGVPVSDLCREHRGRRRAGASAFAFSTCAMSGANVPIWASAARTETENGRVNSTAEPR